MAAAPAPLTRERLSLASLLVLVVAGIVLSLLVVAPFVPGLTWALAFAILANPFHTWVTSRIRNKDAAAGFSVLAVALVLMIPLLVLGWQLGREAAGGLETLQKYQASSEWTKALSKIPGADRIINLAAQTIDIEQQFQQITGTVRQYAGQWIQNALWGVMQMAIALFSLFYFFRDRGSALHVVRSGLPLSAVETDRLFKEVYDMTYATIYGTIVVSLVQGALGGLMFWILGLGAPVLWGFAMFVLSLIPMLGAPVVWGPAALVLIVSGSWGKGLFLIGWGILVVGSIDNLLYPVLVGQHIRLHTLPVFFSVVGGVFVFGAAGLVLGPVIVAITLTLLVIIHQRTALGRSAEEKT